MTGPTFRQLTMMDRLLVEVDAALRTLTRGRVPSRPSPAAAIGTAPAEKDPDASLSPAQQRESLGCMRVNHSGEVCAQALYRGQQWLVQNAETQAMLRQAEIEEIDHLAWCAARVQELGGRCSYLDPFWYLHSFFIGVLASYCGDAYSLGFIEETESQVSQHLQNHLARLPAADVKSRAIVEQMRIDEERHGRNAKLAGGRPLPRPVQELMRVVARVMTTAAYYL